jgi:hypothetical protein
MPSGVAGTTAGGGKGQGFPSNPQPIILSDDAGYGWFKGERALLVGDRLIVGTVAAGWADEARRGDIDAVVYEFSNGQAKVVELRDRLELNDHASAALLGLGDARVLALYSKSGSENRFYYRIATGDSLLDWGPEQSFSPSVSTRLSASNLMLLTAERSRIYDFYRGLDDRGKPSFAYSDDLGQTWQSGNVFIDAPSQGHRPYVLYANNGADTVHFVYNETHPRDYDNSVYHAYYRDGVLYGSDGAALQPLSQGLSSPSQGSLVFRGDADRVAWVMDLTLDASGHPVALFSVRVGSAGLPAGQGGDDIRYRYARWDGSTWFDYALAYGGSRLYAGEDDYSGLAALDPGDPNVVFISTNSDPLTAAPLVSAADGTRHYEIFRGITADAGQTWQWTAVTHDSLVDNLRPVVPNPQPAGNSALLWLRGTYRSFTDYQQELVAIFWNR